MIRRTTDEEFGHGPEDRLFGALLLDPQQIDEIAAWLSPDQIIEPNLAKAYQALLAMNEANKPIDPVTFAGELERRGIFEDCGGVPWLMRCQEAGVVFEHAASYAKQVIERYRRAEAVELGSELTRIGRTKTEDVDDGLGRIGDRIHDILDRKIKRTDTADLATVLSDAIFAMDQPKEQGIPAGFYDLDELTGGLRAGRVYVVAARPSCGKSAFVTNIALNVANNGDGVLFVSLEMSKLEIASRIIARWSGVAYEKIEKGVADNQERSQICDAAEQMSRLPVLIDDAAEASIREVAAKMRRAVNRKGVRLVIIDYLQLIEPEDRKVNREQQVAQMSRRLKQLAKSMSVPVIVLSQLNRAVEARDNKRPKLSDLRESGAIEQDADQVWMLYRPDDKDDVVEVGVVKNRNGRLGWVPLSWQGATMAFRDMPSAADQVRDWD